MDNIRHSHNNDAFFELFLKIFEGFSEIIELRNKVNTYLYTCLVLTGEKFKDQTLYELANKTRKRFGGFDLQRRKDRIQEVKTGYGIAPNRGTVMTDSRPVTANYDNVTLGLPDNRNTMADVPRRGMDPVSMQKARGTVIPTDLPSYSIQPSQFQPNRQTINVTRGTEIQQQPQGNGGQRATYLDMLRRDERDGRAPNRKDPESDPEELF